MIQTLFGTVEQEPTLLEKLKSGVQKTRAGLVSALEDALQGRKEKRCGLTGEESDPTSQIGLLDRPLALSGKPI